MKGIMKSDQSARKPKICHATPDAKKSTMLQHTGCTTLPM